MPSPRCALNALLLTLILSVGCTALPQGGGDQNGWKELGAIRVKGGGLPGYDINGDGKADYTQAGFFQYVEVYDKGGFDYPGGEVDIVDAEKTISLPPLHFAPSDLAESTLGSVVIFLARDDATGLEVEIIVKTLGKELNTYRVLIDGPQGSYRFIDLLDEKGAGTFDVDEVEIETGLPDVT